MNKVQTLPAQDASSPTIAVLEHLSGPSIGTETFLYSEHVAVELSADRQLSIRRDDPDTAAGPGKTTIARLARGAGTYNLTVPDGCVVWVNGRKVQSVELIDDDVIEFGEKGPLSRYRLFDASHHSRRYFTEICSDSWDYLRSSRKPLVLRTFNAVTEFFKRLLGDTSGLFRIAMLSGLAFVAFVTYQQYRLNQMQAMQLQSSVERIDSFSEALSQSQQNSLTPADLDQLREDFAKGLTASETRLSALERKSAAAQTVIQASAPSVVFLQGGYGFRERGTEKMLRHVVGPDGKPVMGPAGRPLLSLEGDGPPAERSFTGTGFAIDDGRTLVTNRHIAVPWQSEVKTGGAGADRLEPVLVKFVAYSPGSKEAWPVELLVASDKADLALLRVSGADKPLMPLPLATRQLASGDVAIVMGYPTGLRSIVARAGDEFVSQIREGNTTSFWDVAAALARLELIKPLSSMGIVAQLTSQYIVYDAATTSGGSGGPVLNINGEVVAVNAAILPEYGGSNLGVPVAKLKELMTSAGL